MTSDVNHITEDNRKSSQKEAAGDLSGYTLHMADMASDNYEREFSLNLASEERNTLLDIDEALKRIEEGKYGKCVSCGKDIAKKRLTAVPQAKLCLTCKKKEESK
jgi:RNA polymerase-binding protein DksA